jgi:hypothetical protein
MESPEIKSFDACVEKVSTKNEIASDFVLYDVPC